MVLKPLVEIHIVIQIKGSQANGHVDWKNHTDNESDWCSVNSRDLCTLIGRLMGSQWYKCVMLSIFFTIRPENVVYGEKITMMPLSHLTQSHSYYFLLPVASLSGLFILAKHGGSWTTTHLYIHYVFITLQTSETTTKFKNHMTIVHE